MPTEAETIVERLRKNRAALDHFDVSKYRCLGAQVLVKRLDLGDDVTAGGIIKPEIARQRSERAEVVLAGPGEYQNGTFMPMTVQPGEKVVITRYGGTDIELDGAKFTLVHMSQLYMAENL